MVSRCAFRREALSRISVDHLLWPLIFIRHSLWKENLRGGFEERSGDRCLVLVLLMSLAAAWRSLQLEEDRGSDDVDLRCARACFIGRTVGEV